MPEIKLLRPFEFARKMAYLSPFDKRFQMGAVICKRNKVLGFGHNKLKTAGARYPRLFSIHAELAAIINSMPYKTNLQGTDIFVYRETSDFIPAEALPCETCYGAILDAGIKRVFYSVNYEPYYEVIEI